MSSKMSLVRVTTPPFVEVVGFFTVVLVLVTKNKTVQIELFQTICRYTRVYQDWTVVEILRSMLSNHWNKSGVTMKQVAKLAK